MPKTPDVDDGATLPNAEADHTSVGPAPGGDDGIEEISPDELAGGSGPRQVGPGQKVTLGAPPPPDAGPEKTRVASLDDLAEPPAPANAEKTMIMQAPGTAPPVPDDHEATMIMANPTARRPVERGRLVVVSGKAEGERFELHDGTLVVGRSRDADVCLLDIQASRRHAEIVVDGGGARVRDLGSGNGTSVNGEPVTEVELADGDEIAIGDHVLRYEAPAGGGALVPAGARGAPGTAVVAAPAVPSVAAVRRARRNPQGNPGRRRLLVVAGAVAALMVVLVGVKLALGPATPAKPAKPTVSPAVAAEHDFEAGLALFKKGAYAGALAKFQAAHQADPNLGKATEYVKATRREMAAAAAIAKGKSLLAAGKYDQARAAFKSVGSDSLRYADAQAGLQRVAQAQGGEDVGQGQQGLDATRTRLDALVTRVKGIPGGAGDVKAKRQAFQDAIAAIAALGGNLDGPEKAFAHALQVNPDDAQAKAGQDAVAKLRHDLAGRQAWARGQLDDWQHHVAATDRQAHARQVRKALAPGVQQFDQGQFHQAASTFTQLVSTTSDRDVKRLASQKLTALKRFLPAYNEGMSAPSNRPSPGALKALAVAYAQAKVVDPRSPLLSKVQVQLGRRYYLKGRVAYNAKRYPEAYEAWTRALRFDPGQSLSQKGLTDLKHLAKKLYLQAYVQKSLNRGRAIAAWKQVIRMTPASDSYHQKAEQRLQEMGAQ